MNPKVATALKVTGLVGAGAGAVLLAQNGCNNPFKKGIDSAQGATNSAPPIVQPALPPGTTPTPGQGLDLGTASFGGFSGDRTFSVPGGPGSVTKVDYDPVTGKPKSLTLAIAGGPSTSFAIATPDLAVKPTHAYGSVEVVGRPTYPATEPVALGVVALTGQMGRYFTYRDPSTNKVYFVQLTTQDSDVAKNAANFVVCDTGFAAAPNAEVVSYAFVQSKWGVPARLNVLTNLPGAHP